MGNFFRQYLLFILIAMSGLYSCKSTKYIREGEYLLDKVKIESDIPEYKSIELRPYVRQLPNYKMFGINKTMFQLYNLSGRDSTKRINRFLKKIGEEPVIFDSILVDKTNSEFKKLFVIKGYIDVDVSSDIIKKGSKVTVVYHVKGNTPYRVGNYTSGIEDEKIRAELDEIQDNKASQRIPGEQTSTRTSLIKNDMLFDRSILEKERERVSKLLRNRGYYTFNKDYLYYNADSTLNSHTIHLDLKMEPFHKLSSEGKIMETPYEKYYFDKVYIYLDYDPFMLNNSKEYIPSDSIVTNGYTIYYRGDKPSIRPRILLNNNFITPQRLYSQMREDETYTAFSSLTALNNLHIHFDENLREDTARLDCRIMTMSAKKQAVSYAVEGTNTAGNLGVASSVNYTHRNLFRGSETFNFKVRGAYEAISNFSNPYLELGAEAAIHVPKFVFPFISGSFSRKMRSSTEFSLSYNHQNRPEYDRTLLSSGLRYIWQGRERSADRHQFDLLDIDYVYLPKIDSVFLKRLPSGAEYFGYTNQFIVGTGYSYTKSTFDPLQKQRNAHSLRLSFESAGNALYGINQLLDVQKDEQGSYKLFHTYFAQFLKADIDYSKTLVFDKQNSIAWRIGGGIGVPYGNSKMLPFEKRYYSGGSNSVRAWSIRELGPGAYQPNDTTTFFNQSGDIKLDFNIEYRTRFFWKFEAATFIDAGNIWTIKNYAGQEGGVFKMDSFYKQIAVGYGIGLRLDMDFFLVRFDCGWKVYNPAKTGVEKWAVLHPNFTNNWAWHIAVGYPF
jgi:hypothetical protein